jgi:hypothetical protein
LSSVDL